MALPIFLNIGPGGGGSTSFHNFLCANFELYEHSRKYKEANYLTLRQTSDIKKKKWDLSSSITNFEDYINGYQEGKGIDSSPNYLYLNDLVIKSISELWPKKNYPKVFIIFRNPIKRALSQYKALICLYGIKEVSFSKTCDWWRNEGHKNPYGHEIHPKLPNFSFDYLGHSKYWENIPKYENFLGKENIFITTLDKLIKSPYEELLDISDFINLELKSNKSPDNIKFPIEGQKNAYRNKAFSKIINSKKSSFISNTINFLNLRTPVNNFKNKLNNSPFFTKKISIKPNLITEVENELFGWQEQISKYVNPNELSI